MLPNELNPTLKNSGYGGLNITRIVPGNECVEVEWSHDGSYIGKGGEFIIEAVDPLAPDIMGRHAVFLYLVPHDARSFVINGLSNGIDYLIKLSGYQDHVKVAQAQPRLVRPCPAPGVTVAYCHPEDYTFNSSGRSPASPAIMRLPNGRLLISHDFYWARGGQNLSHMYYSDDNGVSWHFLSEIKPCFWGKPFWHQDKLFMISVSTEYGDFNIFRSDDMGKTWSEPTILYPGTGVRGIPGPHRAPMPIVNHGGRLWTTMEYGTWEIDTKHDAGVASIDVNADPMVASNWAFTTPFSRYDKNYPGAVKGGSPGHHEGNVVVTPDGGLVNFLRYHTINANPDYGKALLYSVDMKNPSGAMTFDKIIDFPGNMSKFAIMRDPVDGLYVSLVNRVSLPWRGQRNILSLSVSEDMINWRIVHDLINYQDNGWPEGYKLVGFQYVDFFIEDGDIYYASRTALGGANNYHDANRISFHKLDNYRQYL